MSDMPLLDRKLACENLGGDDELLSELIELFLGDAPARIAELSEAASAADWPRACAAAHALKGGAATVGAIMVSQRASELETLGKRADAVAAATLDEAAVSLRDAVERTLAALGDSNGGEA